MMKALTRKLTREIYHAKGLLGAITSIIVVGVTCYVALQSSYRNLSFAKRDYHRQCRMPDFWIDLKKTPNGEVNRIAEIEGVSEVRSRISFAASVDIEDSIEPVNGLVLSLPDAEEPVLCGVVLRQGDYFSPQSANEVIVNESFARAHHLYPGQKIHLLMNNRRQELRIVGTALSSEFTYLLGPGALVPDPLRFGVFYIKRSFAEEVYDFAGASNQIVGRFAPDSRGEVDTVLDEAEARLEPFGVFGTTPLRLQASNQFLSNEISSLGAFSTVIPMIFLAVAAVILNVLLTRVARQQRVVVGTLKALGYTNTQVFTHFVLFGLSVGFAGGLIGSLLGYLASTGMTSVYRYYMEFPDLTSRVYVGVMTIGMTVSLLCAVAGALYGAITMLRLQPAEAMRPEPPRSGGAIFLERFGWFWHRLSAPWRMALRTVVRQRVRSLAAVFASMMGAGLLVTGFMMQQSQNYLLEFQFYRTSRSDLDVTFKDEHGRDALDEIAALPGVDHAEPMLDVACTFKNGRYERKGGITGLASDARLTTPRDAAGETLDIPTHGLLLTKRLAEILHVQPGDTVTITPVQGEREPKRLVVRGIADSYMGLAAYANIEYLSSVINEAYVMTGAQLQIDPAQKRALFLELKNTPSIQSTTLRANIVRNVEKVLLENQMVTITAIVSFAGIVFFGSIVSASFVNLAERQREVATFRALGYSIWQIGGVFLRESMLTNLVGTLLGLPIGYGLVVLTTVSYNNDLIRLPVVTAPWIWAVTFLLSISFALIAHAVVQWQIYRMNILEALKVKE